MARPSRLPRFIPRFEHWPAAGVYQLWLRLPARLRLTVGRLGRCTFPPGVYVYTGRAARGLRARVWRHVCVTRCSAGGSDAGRRPRKRWHIDYLLSRCEVRLVRVLLVSPDATDECAINRGLADGAACVAAGFGASDCRAGCATHLWLVRRPARGVRRGIRAAPARRLWASGRRPMIVAGRGADAASSAAQRTAPPGSVLRRR